MPGRAFSEVAERVRTWLVCESFPFWAQAAPDPSGGFYERLDLAGVGIDGEDSRVRLQARMAFSFSLAAELGWDHATSKHLTERALLILIDKCRRKDGLYGKRVDTAWGLTDPTIDAYDNAFVLLAFGTALRVFDDFVAFDAGCALLRSLQDRLVRPGGLQTVGIYEQLPDPALRSQNPHMHMTEALLCWFEVTGNEGALSAAQDIVQFVATTFVHSASGTLFEYDSGHADNRVEVGHLYEWVWILTELDRLGGSVPEEMRERLFTRASDLVDHLGYIPLSQSPTGVVLEPIQRTWGLAEKLKAQLSLWRITRDLRYIAMACETTKKIFDDHLNNSVRGAWTDVIDEHGSPMIDDITPATGYHLFLAFRELLLTEQQLTEEALRAPKNI